MHGNPTTSQISDVDHARIQAAVEFWFEQKASQLADVLKKGTGQGGTRDAVVGGTHLDGLNTLVVDQLRSLGVSGLTYRTSRSATLPGYYRAAKSWDLLVLRNKQPILAVEYKSMKGSEGKNLNNRADEVLGVGEDLREAQRQGLVPAGLQRAYIFIMEATPAVRTPVATRGVYGGMDPVFDRATYLDRMGILCERIRDTGLYNLTWAIAAVADPVSYCEPNPAVGWTRFSADLAKAFT